MYIQCIKCIIGRTKMEESGGGGGENVRVVVRVRPLNANVSICTYVIFMYAYNAERRI